MAVPLSLVRLMGARKLRCSPPALGSWTRRTRAIGAEVADSLIERFGQEIERMHRLPSSSPIDCGISRRLHGALGIPFTSAFCRLGGNP